MINDSDNIPVAEANIPSTVLAGRYALLSRLGQGASGEVYLATDTQLPNLPRVAIKVLTNNTLNPRTIERFRREVIVLQKLAHSNIVQVFEFDCHTVDEQSKPLHYFVMEYVPGTTVRQFMAGPVIPFAQVLELFIQLLKALEHAHAHGVLHRDLKPENVLITPDGTLKLLDFGVARDYDTKPGAALTAREEVLGTPAYLAPELLNGEEANPQSDLYSAALICIELLNGKASYVCSNQYELYQSKLKGHLPKIHRSDVPHWFRQLLLNTAHFERSTRFDSATAILQAISDGLEQEDAAQRSSLRNVLRKSVVAAIAVFLLFTIGIAGLARAHVGTQLDLFNLAFDTNLPPAEAPTFLQKWLDFQPDQLSRYLFQAASRGHYVMAEWFLRNGASATSPILSDKYPIEEAISASDGRMFALLLAHGASITLQNGRSTWAALCTASPELLEMALRNETPPYPLPGESIGLLSSAVLWGSTAHLEILLNPATPHFNFKVQDFAALQLALERYASAPSKETKANFVLLLHKGIMQRLTSDAEIADALQYAAQLELWDMVDLLLDTGPKPRQALFSIMQKAVDTNETAFLNRLFLRGSRFDGQLVIDIFSYALRSDNQKLMRFIVTHAASPNIKNDLNVGFLYFAMLLGNEEAVRFLLTLPGFDMNQTDEYGRGPLIWTLYSGRYKLLSLLLDTKMPIIDLEKGRSLYLEIVRHAPYEILEKYLRRRGPTDWNLAEESAPLVALDNPDTRVFERVLMDPGLHGCRLNTEVLRELLNQQGRQDLFQILEAFQ